MCDRKTIIFVEILTYAYNLEYEERPDYNRLRFMFKKILLDKNFVPWNKFDWSANLRKIEKYDQNNSLRSISSCNLNDNELPVLEFNKFKSLN